MNWLAFFYNLLLVGIGTWTILKVYKLTQEFVQDYLFYFLYYLIAINVFGFIMYFLADLVVILLLSSLPEKLQYQFYWTITLLQYPILVALVYFYLSMFLALSQKKFTRPWKRVFFIVSSGFVPFFVLGFYKFIKYENIKLLKIVYIYILEWMVFAFLLGMPLMAIFLARKNREKQRTLVLEFSFLYIAGHGIYHIFHQFLDYSVVVYIILPFLFFLMNVPPFLSLQRNLKCLGLPAFLAGVPQKDHRTFFLKFKISPREAEIIMLLFKGLRIADIEEELYISKKTIKNHIYSIYKKTGVSTRVQLFNKLLQNQNLPDS